MKTRGWIAALGGLAAAGAVAGAAAFGQPAQPQSAASAASNPQLVARGRYLTAAGDCQSCHTKAGGQPFAGGRAIPTPFGTLLSANITPDETGIKDWTPDEFYRALHTGVDDEGKHLYPAFPYNYYTLITRADSDAIYAYLRTVAPAHNSPNRNQLPFPFNIRPLLVVWNWLFLHEGPFKANPAKSAEWNRGAYLVEALGHCQACHTPKNFLGAAKSEDAFHGGSFGSWFAPDLTRNDRRGLGAWSRADLIEFLKTGRNIHAAAAGEMGEVVAYSTSQMSDADLGAIATYLTDQPASPAISVQTPSISAMRQGEAIFVDSCSACHAMDGRGAPRFFPPLAGDANLQQADPTTTLHYILGGVRSEPTASAPTPLAMPSYAWKLNDSEIAAVATYVRNSWGNSAPAVTNRDVATVRQKLTFGRGPSGSVGHPPLSHPTPETWGVAGTDSRDNGTPNAGRPAPASDGVIQEPSAGGDRSPGSNGHPAGTPAGGGPG